MGFIHESLSLNRTDCRFVNYVTHILIMRAIFSEYGIWDYVGYCEASNDSNN